MTTLRPFIVSSLLFCCAFRINAGVDPVTAGAVVTNMEVLKGTYDERADKQKKIASAQASIIAGLAVIHDVERKTVDYLSNISGALQNLYQIKESATLAVSITKRTQDVLDACKRHPKGAIFAPIVSKEITRLSSEALSLYPFMQQLVTSGSYNQGENAKKVNLLNSAERYFIADMIYHRLDAIDRSLLYLYYQILYFNWEKLLYRLDRDTWAQYWNTRGTCDQIKYRYERFKHRY